MATPELNLNAALSLYNTTHANKARFIKDCQTKYNVDEARAEKMFNYMASMEKNQSPGLTPAEYKEGLIEKKESAEIRQAKILDQYVPKADREKFAQMSQTEKLEYMAAQTSHEPGRETEAHIMAELSLGALNILDAEIERLNQALEEVKENEKPLTKTKLPSKPRLDDPTKNVERSTEATFKFLNEQNLRKDRAETKDNIKSYFNGLG